MTRSDDATEDMMTNVSDDDEDATESSSVAHDDSDSVHSIVVELTDAAYKKLHGAAKRRDLTVQELVKDGVALAEWLGDEGARGQLLIKEGGSLREVFPPGK